MKRVADGSRKIIQVSEVQAMEGEIIVMQDIFRFVQTDFDQEKVQGHFTATGVRPKFVEKFASMGISLPPELFVPQNTAANGKRFW